MRALVAAGVVVVVVEEAVPEGDCLPLVGVFAAPVGELLPVFAALSVSVLPREGEAAGEPEAFLAGAVVVAGAS